MGARSGGSQFLLTSQCASRNTTTTPFASFAPLVRDLVVGNVSLDLKLFVAEPEIKVFGLAIKVLLIGQKPDKTFPLRISDQADKTSEDPDVVLQTLEKKSRLDFALIARALSNYSHLSQIFFVREIVNE